MEAAVGWGRAGDGRVGIRRDGAPGWGVAYCRRGRGPSGQGAGGFRKVAVYECPEGTGQGHGLGCGDIAGNGRMDIVLCKGWLEAPGDPEQGTWIWHEDFPIPPWGWSASIPRLVVDINGDGMNAIIPGNAHGYGSRLYKSDPSAQLMGRQIGWGRRGL